MPKHFQCFTLPLSYLCWAPRPLESQVGLEPTSFELSTQYFSLSYCDSPEAHMISGTALGLELMCDETNTWLKPQED